MREKTKSLKPSPRKAVCHLERGLSFCADIDLHISMKFKEWINLSEALGGALAVAANNQINWIMEGRRDPEALRTKKPRTSKETLWGPEKSDKPTFSGCPNIPISSYDKETPNIRKYALQNPENMAQVLLFSPLSANVGFNRHWNNFPVLMLILRELYPNGITLPQIKKVIAAFNDSKYKLSETIHGWKLETVVYVWNHRHELYDRLKHAAEHGDDVDLISELIKIPGAAPVKAGFMAQLVFGRTGCIDIHNIDIYSKAFPDLKDELNPKDWERKASEKATHKAVKTYANVLKKLSDRGIGTKQLWDVWVDFVGHMYEVISPTRGYGKLGPALNPNDPAYKDLKTTIIKWDKEAPTAAEKPVGIPTITGTATGGGAGAAHTIAAVDPAQALLAFSRGSQGEELPDWAKAVQASGFKGTGGSPSLLHYFRGAVDPAGRGIDPEYMKRLIRRRIEKGEERTSRKAAAEKAQMPLFGQ